MAKNEKVYFTKDLRFKPVSFTASDTTIAKQIFNPSAEGSRVDGLAISSTSATQRTLLLQVNNGAGEISPLGHITVPAGAGTNGSVAVVSGLNRGNLPWLKIDSNGNPYINLNSGMNLEAKMLTTLGAGETISITTFGANYDA
ncbi:hypothetical protein [Nubsella zeaxanthinifaciens]|uniref:hypothetical protein n=1 Tax=Nubsella zeaxanthinifaciens TaxID=392412 RepID=UPI000DE1E56D|nr:hypothetical protein [Nubsella zeaxanthinifaciens]